MTVGILTYHWVANFGANLQALSTFCYLKNAGCNPIIINWIPEDLESYYENNVTKVQFDAHKQFAKDNFDNISDICRNSSDIARVINLREIDTVVIGSDAVFSLKPILSRIYIGRKGLKFLKVCSDAKFPNPFWGSFLNELDHNVNIISLSASAQNSPYKKMIIPGEREKYYQALSRFKKITVRDIWTQNMIKYISKGKISADITPDPVFAFNHNVKPQKRAYIERTLNYSGRYVLVSMPSVLKNTKWIYELETLFESQGIRLIWLPKTNKFFDCPIKSQLQFPINPLDWYDAIKYSEGYIGELMHPVLVSLHNSVPVYAFDTYGFKKKGSLDILSSKTFQIMHRFGLIENNYYNKLFNEYPTPQVVFDSIMNFDKAKVMCEAGRMLDEYLNMMNDILNI